ncbi:MAG: YggS family pyridoxal phosphate-dependent enzyme [Ectothiorhodospiraceae bacterium]|nr:YggS family pyridoxal phosphate-dependent enzyme [Ectothiorhodospiraceae bacterium]
MPENCPSGKQNLKQRLSAVQTRVRAAEIQFGRPADSVQILPVSKNQPSGMLAEVSRLTATTETVNFAESYLQEAMDKMRALIGLTPCWHFIGPIQSNKTAAIAQHFQWVHSVDRLKIARRLSEQRPAELPPLNVCLQVNVSNERSKSGVLPGDLLALVEHVVPLPRLRLRGLMAIPAATKDKEQQRAAFREVREAFTLVKEKMDINFPAGAMQYWDTLSMGMSGDLEAAIAEGATIVRIGAGIFGPRPDK